MTLGVSFLLSKTALKGLPSFFALELPPYRRPQVGQVLVRSVLDRTLAGVWGGRRRWRPRRGCSSGAWGMSPGPGRAFSPTAPGFWSPLPGLFGLDGVILLAFLLALPANELVLPLLLMGYLSQGALVEVGELCHPARPAAGERLDLGDGFVRAGVHLVPLALLHHLLDHLEGDKKPEVDGPVHGFAHGLRPAAVLFDFLRRPPAGLVAFVEGN